MNRSSGLRPLGRFSARLRSVRGSSLKAAVPAVFGSWAGCMARRSWPLLRSGENLLIVLALGAMTLLPLIEVPLRKIFHTGISGSSALVQHFVLIVGMLGGAMAAREGRLLSLSSLSALLKGRAKAAALVSANAVAAGISVLLALASWRFLLTEKAGGKILAYGIPIWILQLALPLGFAAVALRLVWHASDAWRGRLLGALLASAIPVVFVWPPLALAGLFVAAVLGAPVFALLGGAALILFWSDGLPLATVPLKHYSLVTNVSLPTIPLFTLAGYFLAEGGASKRLVGVFQALAGHVRGGPAVATALVCAFFTSFTGASGVTILALGGLLMPVLLAARYSERTALGLLTGAGSLGLLFPPCLPLILYSIVASTVVSNLDVANADAAQVSMEKMFLGGIGPGILMVALTAWWGIRQGPSTNEEKRSFNWAEARRALWEAKWELLLPVVALGALFGGFATPVEAAAVTALYAFIVETFLYRDLKIIRDIPRVMAECGLLVGGVLLILGVAMGFTHYLIMADVPTRAVEWIQGAVQSEWLFLLLLNLALLGVGCLMDIFSAIVVVVPLIVPMGVAFGIDPVHLGIIFLANLKLGYLTPPVGMNLFLASYRFGKPIPEVTRAALPMLLVLLVGVLLITYVPPLTTALPHWLAGRAP